MDYSIGGICWYIYMKGETHEKLIFAPFGKILVLVNAFFYLNFNSRSICISICIIFIYHQTNHLGLSEYSICEIWRLFTRGNLSTWWMCRSRGSTIASCWNWIAKTHSPKPRSCQKLQKSIFNTFLIRNWIAKTHSPKPRSCQKLQNRFLIWNWIEKTHSPKPRSCQKLQNRFFTTFLIWNWIEKTHSPRPKSCQMVQKFNLKLNKKTHSPKPRSCQMVQKSFFSILFQPKYIIFFLWVGKYGNILSVPFFVLTLYCKNILSVGWKSWSQNGFFWLIFYLQVRNYKLSILYVSIWISGCMCVSPNFKRTQYSSVSTDYFVQPLVCIHAPVHHSIQHPFSFQNYMV